MSKKVIVIAGSLILLLILVNFIMLLHINGKLTRYWRETWQVGMEGVSTLILTKEEFMLEDMANELKLELDELRSELYAIQQKLLRIEGCVSSKDVDNGNRLAKLRFRISSYP